MKWYNELSKFLCNNNREENPSENSSTAGIRDLLKERVIDLYKQIFLYITKSVCSGFRNRFSALLRDMLKLDDWNGNIKGVEDAENLVRQG